jgi:hypothetical protein
MNNGDNKMTDFENTLRLMLTPKEVALLDRVLNSSPARDGGIASLVAYALRAQEQSGLLDILHGESK